MSILPLHLQFRLCDLTVLFQTHKPLGGCLGICTSLTLPHCMVNYIGASPELLNKSPLFEGVTHPTCSAQDLHLEHQSGLSSHENCFLLFLFGFLMAFVQVHSLKKGFFSQSTELAQISAGARAVHSNLWFLTAISKFCCITKYCSVLFNNGVFEYLSIK